jgi:hypothetical protein
MTCLDKGNIVAQKGIRRLAGHDPPFYLSPLTAFLLFYLFTIQNLFVFSDSFD